MWMVLSGSIPDGSSMLRSEEQITEDIQNVPNTRRKKILKQFYKDCLLLLKEGYEEHYLIEERARVMHLIRVINNRRKRNNPHESGTETRELYKEDLKQQRRYLKSLKYLLNETKSKVKGTSRPGNVVRIRAYWDAQK